MYRWLVLIIEEETNFDFEQEIKELDKNDGELAPISNKETESNKQFHENNGQSTVLSKKKIQTCSLLVHIFNYFMDKIFWPLIIIVTGGILLSIILE